MKFSMARRTPRNASEMPIRFVFELTKSGWKFSGLGNVNE
jgi:hypothetical protein